MNSPDYITIICPHCGHTFESFKFGGCTGYICCVCDKIFTAKGLWSAPDQRCGECESRIVCLTKP